MYGFQFNILHISGRGLIFNDEMYLVVPATHESKKMKGEFKIYKNMKYWNVTKFAKEMASYKDTITFIIFDVDR